MKKGIYKQFFLLVLLLVLLTSKGYSQYFLTGQDPASVKWDQIKTKHFQVIYPREYAQMAQYYINLLTLTSPHVSQPYVEMSEMKRLSVILHNHTTTSNAMVGIAPMRADFFEMTPQDSYPQLWADQLALHEYRHAVQMNTMRQGLTKGFYYVFGEQGIAAVMGLWLPFWFIEGDAVYGETMMSNSGRGRVPNFIYPLSAQILDKKIYKYDKATFGSYKNFVPDHYTLGYQLVAKGVEQYGMGMWNFTIDRVARRPYYLVPFTTSIKKQTGKFKVQFYNQTLRQLKNEWWITDKKEIDSSTLILSPETRFYTSYLFPNPLENGDVIVEKTSLDDVNRFVLISKEGEESRLFTPGFDLQQSLSVSGDVLCWNERGYDHRWSMRTYSVIKLYNYKTKKLKKLTPKSRYFAPALSNSGEKIVAVQVNEEAINSLHILDAETGNVLKEIRTEDNLFFMTPHWSNNDKYIVMMVLGKNGKSLFSLNTEDWSMNQLLPFSFKEIKWPVMHNDWVVYTGTYEGKDQLYSVNVKTKISQKVFEPRFGANYASFSKDGNRLYFSYYTADGHKLSSIEFLPDHNQETLLSDLNHTYLADKLLKPDQFNLDETVVPDSNYSTKKYNKAAHLFNLHSWAPLAVDVNNYTINPGVTLLSQNVLSSSVTSLSWIYDPNEMTSKIKFGYEYFGLYPVLGFSVDYGGRKIYHNTEDGVTHEVKWRETNLSVNVSIPLVFTSSKWIQGIRPSVGIDQKFLKMNPDSELSFREDRVTAPIYRLYAYNQHKMSPKDIYPHWGQSMDVLFRNTPLSDSISSQLALTGWLYFPGFVRHQGFRIYGGYQETVTGNYSFSNFVAIPRGYNSVSFPKYVSLRMDYAFPIAYPDLNVPGFFYLKRIYSKVFYDFLVGSDLNMENRQDISSTGVELYTDWNFLSVLLNFNLGVRYSYRFYDDSGRFEFLFGIGLN